MKFTLNRNKMVSGTSGHTIDFVKDVPTHVPPCMHSKVLEIGAVPVENLDMQETVRVSVPSDPQERATAIRKAIEHLVLHNERLSFGANGAPTQEAIAMQTKFSITRKERDVVWKAFRLGDEE